MIVIRTFSSSFGRLHRFRPKRVASATRGGHNWLCGEQNAALLKRITSLRNKSPSHPIDDAIYACARCAVAIDINVCFWLIPLFIDVSKYRLPQHKYYYFWPFLVLSGEQWRWKISQAFVRPYSLGCSSARSISLATHCSFVVFTHHTATTHAMKVKSTAQH